MIRPQLSLLGSFGLSAGGVERALPTRKAQALLALLARRPGAALARAHLAGLLWPDVPDAQGRASLRQALSALRRALAEAGADGPDGRGDAVALPAEALDVDVAELERALARGDLAAAVRHYRGPLLDGFPPVTDLFDAWLEGERQALAARAAGALRERLGALAEAGDVEALALGERALALDPAFEPAYRARMRVLAAGGDRAGALREFERCRAALARAVGAEPSAETQALRRALEQETGRPEERRAPTVAVLPFEVLALEPSAEVFARGLAEEVGLALSRFRSLQVIARESAARAAAEGLDAAGLGRALGAEYLLSGSVRAAGGRLRAAPRLVEAASGRQLWAERYDADLAEVFDVQDRIAGAVASALVMGIDARELERARERAPERLDAYACCVRGMTALRAGSAEGDREARALFQRALALDPGCARALSGLSLSHFNDWSCSAWERWDENEREAFRYAEAAERLDPRDHHAHCVLARILCYRREFDGAAHHLERALALNGSDADALVHLAVAATYLGDAGRGRTLAQAARRLHPFHPDWYDAALAFAHLLGREPRQAIALVERAPDLFVDSRALLAVAHAHLGELTRAREEAVRFLHRFQRQIAPGARPADAVTWMLRVNPLRRAEDRAWLVAGLVAAGVPADAAALEAGGGQGAGLPA
ncbi:MAG: BTAD domain-containing putative transcriptional regulator [Anaeromyxobacter sp.]